MFGRTCDSAGGGLNRPKSAQRNGIRTCEGFCLCAGQALFERCWADHPASLDEIGDGGLCEERYWIVACTVITDVPEAVGPLPVALMAKVSLPLYRAFAVYS